MSVSVRLVDYDVSKESGRTFGSQTSISQSRKSQRFVLDRRID